MKKFIVAFDGLKFSDSTLQYALYYARACRAHLVGVFLEDFMRRSYGVQEISQYAGADLDQHMHDLDEQDDAERDRSVDIFRQQCAAAEVSHSVHRDRNVALQELLQESIYADLLIAGTTETLTRLEEGPPTTFIRDLLNEVQCPILLAPPVYHMPEKITLLYDGSPSSVYAVRTFSYLFEPVKHLDTEVLTVKKETDDALLPNGRLIREFIRQHYPKADVVVLKGRADDVITAYLQRDRKHSLVVLGAYQRSSFSRMFKPSMADVLMRHLRVPLFIAHRRT